jgi:hypothetical protein
MIGMDQYHQIDQKEGCALEDGINQNTIQDILRGVLVAHKPFYKVLKFMDTSITHRSIDGFLVPVNFQIGAV